MQIFSSMCSILNINEILPFNFKPFILQNESVVQFTQNFSKKLHLFYLVLLYCPNIASIQKALKMLKKFLWDSSVRVSLDGVNIPITASLCRATLGISMAVSVCLWIGHKQMDLR